MDLIAALLAAGLFPAACLAFLLWMARFEDGLPEAVRRAVRVPDPPPIRSVPVRRPAPRVGPPAVRPAVPAQRAEVSRSAALSLGGSTNR